MSNAALLSKPDAKRTSRKAKRIQHFYHVKDGCLFQRDASTGHADVMIEITPEQLKAIAFQLNRAERLIAVLKGFDVRLAKAYGSPIERTVHPELAFVWRSARIEIADAERDEA